MFSMYFLCLHSEMWAKIPLDDKVHAPLTHTNTHPPTTVHTRLNLFVPKQSLEKSLGIQFAAYQKIP